MKYKNFEVRCFEPMLIDVILSNSDKVCINMQVKI